MTKAVVAEAEPTPMEERERLSAERAEVEIARKDRERANAPRVKWHDTSSGKAVGPAEGDAVSWERAIRNVMGTNSGAYSGMLGPQLSGVKGASSDDALETLRRGLAFMAGVQPADEVQAALGAQMFATHCASMEMSRRMMTADTVQKLEAYGSLATKLARTFTAQAEALAKLRSGGKQQVEVRYVYVDARGSQNVIGLPGARGIGENGHPPHAPGQLAGSAAALGLPMRGADALGLALSGACDQGAEAMPDARRPEPRSPLRAVEPDVEGRRSEPGVDGGATGVERFGRPGKRRAA